jgi:catechol 2,3-dioxygenase-like lactoylglutathione lyase family enzyme
MLSNNTMYAALPVHDLKEAMDFYGTTLGLTMVDRNENGTWYQTGTSRIALYYSAFAGTNKGTAAIWEVDDPKSTVRSLRARGIKFEKYDLPGSRRRGFIHHFASYEAAWFADPSGNLICITHHL